MKKNKAPRHVPNAILKSILHPFNLIFLLPFIYNPFYGANPSETPKLSFFLIVLALLTAWHLYRTFGQKPLEFKIDKKLAILIALFLLSAIISTIFSFAPIESIFGFYMDAKGLIPLLCWTLFFLYAYTHFKENEYTSQSLILIEIIGLLCSAYAVYQKLTMDYSSIFGAGQLFAGRIYSFFSNPNDFGQYLIFPFFAALINLITNRQRQIRYLHIASLLLISAALLLSVNRASILAIIIGMIAYFFIKIKNRKAKIIGIIITAGSIIFGLVILLTSARSIFSRLLLWTDSLQLVFQKPLIGFGPSTFPSIIQPVLSPGIYSYEQMMALPNHPHNETLSLLLSQGFLGLVIATIFLSTILYYGFKKATADNHSLLHFALITTISTIVTAQFTYLQITQIAYLAISLAIICITIGSEKTSFNIKLNGTRYFIAPVIIFLTLFAAFKLTLTDNMLGKAMGKTFTDPPEATAIFEQLLNGYQPYSYPYDAYFTLLENQFFTDWELRTRAREHLKQYGAITNYNYQYYSYAGMIAYADGNKSLATQEFETAEHYAPASARVCADNMSAAQEAGDIASAQKAAKRCYGFLPDFIKSASPAQLQQSPSEEIRIFLKSNPVYYQIMATMGSPKSK
ncbi:MAG TPA: O-antigen ligase family protein [Candidatus Gracilibacteria bacterium]|nr:O-antigen ligase family protein [Candidatus Gracilibacteria bacterium]